ncbi:endonuclease/exonuclease/phosphatase family protein [Pelagibius sp.]|uniref:endonuclease/exonuclease/phosphatase family protein n=1 Tax=Pelagibius sp. TaxID=1931238 RepID=UPI002633C366|nr:endonuclease/exonuclease/phosphatase family protein [Pelagibius sp.]
MFHGDIEPHVARGLQILRERIDEEGIPPSKLDESLNIATWNIRDFGKEKSGNLRSEAAIHYIAEIMYQFDLIAITELRDNLSDLRRVMDILGPYWQVVFSDFNSDRAGNRERVGYLFDKRAAVFTGLAAEAEPPRKKNPETGDYESTIEWWRSPYMASFRAGNFDFTLLTAHIRWGSGASARIKPLKTLAKWIDKRQRDRHVFDKDILVMGDFNIPKVDDDLFDAITSKGLAIPRGLRGTDHGSNLARTKHYDQILHHPRHTNLENSVGGILDFYRGNWRDLFPQAHYPDMSKTDFTYQLSDHLPLWIQIDTWTEDEELDQILNPPPGGAG